eukprot:CAMPEP_0172537756 /NCGR_PEP_ID=MMETSP1067-20121228/9303_1 /TAXON_ID=265564 ORGANISM="Thalassiosira punctigera, Strain Tpunct2005C2" /NCGR_SAMPLE_ID=MMETSP1067 /ASSEMBLY_ACC=CAM_ASM_000444 /LENGTH=92 /DNA_ID=CAMNT_0013323119 /DNA_START=226 /DNA_END=500 /DNA_ORIENTATION=+
MAALAIVLAKSCTGMGDGLEVPSKDFVRRMLLLYLLSVGSGVCVWLPRTEGGMGPGFKRTASAIIFAKSCTSSEWMEEDIMGLVEVASAVDS